METVALADAEAAAESAAEIAAVSEVAAEVEVAVGASKNEWMAVMAVVGCYLSVGEVDFAIHDDSAAPLPTRPLHDDSTAPPPTPPGEHAR